MSTPSAHEASVIMPIEGCAPNEDPSSCSESVGGLVLPELAEFTTFTVDGETKPCRVSFTNDSDAVPDSLLVCRWLCFLLFWANLLLVVPLCEYTKGTPTQSTYCDTMYYGASPDGTTGYKYWTFVLIAFAYAEGLVLFLHRGISAYIRACDLRGATVSSVVAEEVARAPTMELTALHDDGESTAIVARETLQFDTFTDMSDIDIARRSFDQCTKSAVRVDVTCEVLFSNANALTDLKAAFDTFRCRHWTEASRFTLRLTNAADRPRHCVVRRGTWEHPLSPNGGNDHAQASTTSDDAWSAWLLRPCVLFACAFAMLEVLYSLCVAYRTDAIRLTFTKVVSRKTAE